jgi:hypothetical protein
MMERYDKKYRELKGMKEGQLVMVEAKHISVPAKKVNGGNGQREATAQIFWTVCDRVAWHNTCTKVFCKEGLVG